MPEAQDPEAFRAFEHAGWERAVEPYHSAWGALTRGTVPALLDALEVGPKTRLLDVACGPGYLAAAAAATGAAVTGVDFSEPMLSKARALNPGLDLRLGDAERLAFADGSFDAVGMNFGMLHLGRPEVAMAEARRVLRAGGRYAFTVWARPELAAGFAIVLAAVAEHGRPVAVPHGPDFFHFSDEGECRRALEGCGLAVPAVRVVELRWRLDSPESVFPAFLRGTARTAALLRGQDGASRERIAAAITRAVARYVTPGGGVEIPMPAILASARRPH